MDQQFWSWTFIMIVGVAGAIFLLSPFCALFALIDSLYWYCSDKRKQKRDPSSVTPEAIAARKRRLIWSAILTVVLGAAYLCLMYLPAGDIAYM